MNARLRLEDGTENMVMQIERNGKWLDQFCPFQPVQELPNRTITIRCGDWCPLFEVHPTDVQLKCAPKLVLFDLEVKP